MPIPIRVTNNPADDVISAIGDVLASSIGPVMKQEAIAALVSKSSPRAVDSETKETTVVAILIESLGDADFQVRLTAVRKLALAVGRSDLFPSDDAFMADEARFILTVKAAAPEMSPSVK